MYTLLLIDWWQSYFYIMIFRKDSSTEQFCVRIKQMFLFNRSPPPELIFHAKLKPRAKIKHSYTEQVLQKFNQRLNVLGINPWKQIVPKSYIQQWHLTIFLSKYLLKCLIILCFLNNKVKPYCNMVNNCEDNLNYESIMMFCGKPIIILYKVSSKWIYAYTNI